MKEFIQKTGIQTAQYIHSKLVQAPDRMFSMGRAILKSEIDSAKSYKGAMKTAIKGGTVAGIVYGTFQGMKGRIQDKETATQQKPVEQAMSFSPEDAKALETAIDKAVPSVKVAFQRFTDDTSKAANEVITKWQQKIEKSDPKKVGQSEGVRVDKSPITTGIIAGVTHITDNKYVAAIPSIAIDALFSSVPQFLAGTAFRASSNITEVAVRHGPEVVQQVGSMAIEAYQKVSKESKHMQDVIRDNKQDLKAVHDTIENTKSKEPITKSTKGHEKDGPAI
ncbi:hypothetical protein NOVO_06470 [Rickettsiales bacterium Ac37b]|nr:hypothetical protein NOVO_06470 [Rickettsiales bacterium Ac37b]